jgi:hypothetical protein
MPSKSKRNRRHISPQNREAIASAAASGAAPVITTAPQSEKAGAAYSSNTRVSAVVAGTFLPRELKWIGVVTLFIIILLIVSYIVFR